MSGLNQTPEPLPLVCAVIDALAAAEAALIGPSDEYEGCAEALAKVRAVLHGVDRTAPISAALALARRDALEEALRAAHDATTHPSAYACREAIRALIDAPAPAASVAAAMLPKCCICGRIVDPREESEGGDMFGARLTSGSWACSSKCWEQAAGVGHSAEAHK
ncbi:hypothetical protein ACFSDD_11125 [Salipiger marinus]|uniref:hypothetical protein n=1 Tax=Salipiger marinus TaxID=555512 RepID=UPI002C9C7EDD|nr:hypothetical protein [Salipiger manganoxidans]MEB3419923.1 hypothetical protein [Salipiger manganoxidans]